MKIERTHDSALVERFIETAGKSLETFRYFSTRPTSVIANHLITLVGTEGGVPVAYGHLDPENGCTWLGVCVAEKWVGTGKGAEVVSSLLGFSDAGGLLVSLTVDEDNLRARKLYEKLGFVLKRQNLKTMYYERITRG
jgi:RimJ/RimL family protein N-acetyltransferase